MREGHELIGWGMATGIWEAMMSPAEAKVRYSVDGKVTVSAAASDIGTGTYTILGQLGADAFGVPLDDVTVQIADSTLPKTGVQGGSWTAASTGSAVQAASRAVIATLLKHASRLENSPLAKVEADQVEIIDGRFCAGSQSSGRHERFGDHGTGRPFQHRGTRQSRPRYDDHAEVCGLHAFRGLRRSPRR
ncbi:molybdopterin cofactor-binding domain-containing protein [Pararhizobium capsulatum]